MQQNQLRHETNMYLWKLVDITAVEALRTEESSICHG